MDPKLYTQLVQILQDYLGPAAERFVVRQIDVYLSGKDPSNLSPDDVKKLERPIVISVSRLTNDQKIAPEISNKLAKLNK